MTYTQRPWALRNDGLFYTVISMKRKKIAQLFLTVFDDARENVFDDGNRLFDNCEARGESL